MSVKHAVLPVVRFRSGATTDQIVRALDAAHRAAVLQRRLP